MIVDWANQEIYEFEWDPNGNMTSLEALYGNTLYDITGTNYSWRNQPLSITKGGSTTYNYRYDHQGHRVYKQEGSNIHYLRGAYGEVLAVYSGGSLTHWNIVRPDGVVIGRREGSTRKYYHRDHLGSTRAVVTAAGSVTEVYDYMPFGDMMDGRITTSSGGAREKFTSHEFDDEVNLYYMQWRRYIPRFGVFTGVDAMADDYPGWSPYNYVMNNPVIFIDPTGMFAVCGTDCGGKLVYLDPESDRARDMLAQAGTIIMMGVNPEHSQSSIPEKINYHTASNQQIIDQILLYLLYMQEENLTEGDLLDIFDYTTSTGAVKGGGESPLFARRSVHGIISLKGIETPLTIQIGTPSTLPISSMVTTFAFPAIPNLVSGQSIGRLSTPHRYNFYLNTPNRVGFRQGHEVLMFSLVRNVQPFIDRYINPSNYGFKIR
jgi:RHS repeat-associated protein